MLLMLRMMGKSSSAGSGGGLNHLQLELGGVAGGASGRVPPSILHLQLGEDGGPWPRAVPGLPSRGARGKGIAPAEAAHSGALQSAESMRVWDSLE